jgi:hypothetical protein
MKRSEKNARPQKSLGHGIALSRRFVGVGQEANVTDRGPFVRGRIIDVTPAAARELGFSALTQVVVNLAWE